MYMWFYACHYVKRWWSCFLWLEAVYTFELQFSKSCALVVSNSKFFEIWSCTFTQN